MRGHKIIKSTKDITVIAVMTAILFVQEQLLSALPGIQLTVFLIVLFSKTLGFAKSSLIVILHILLDNFYMSSFSTAYTLTMLIGWLFIPLTLSTIFKKTQSSLSLALLGCLYSFIYCWLFIVTNYVYFQIDPIIYFLSDIIFELILAGCSFFTIFLLYKPCYKAINLLLN